MTATVIMTFDTDLTTYTNALFDMIGKGIPGTFFADADRIGTVGNPSKDNLLIMAMNGWDIGARVYGLISGAETNMVSSLNYNRLMAFDRLKTAKDQMYSQGFSIKSIAASQRAWNLSLRGMASQLFENVRVTDLAGYGDLSTADRLYFREGGSNSWSSADTLASLSTWLDNLIAAGPNAVGVPVIHRIDTVGDPAYTISPTVFQGFTSYLQSKIASGDVRAVTLRDAFK